MHGDKLQLKIMSKESYLKLLVAHGQHVPSGASVSDFFGEEKLVFNGHNVSLKFRANEMFPEDGMVYCRTDVVSFNHRPEDDVLRLLLQANNLWAGTAGATLGLNGSGTVMMTVARRIGSLNVVTLDAVLNMLCADAERWARRLTAKPKSEPSQPDLQHMLQMRA